jgi:hypothetical protein
MQTVEVLGSESNKKEVQFCRRRCRDEPKIHMEAEEALGKLKRCLRRQISLHSWVRSLVSVWSLSFVGATHRRNYLHAVIHRRPNSKFPKFPRVKPLPYDFVASCHWL